LKNIGAEYQVMPCEPDTNSEIDFDAPPMSPISESFHETDTGAENDDYNALPVSPVIVCPGLTVGNGVKNSERQQVDKTSCAVSS